jgi:hypothetical protein
MFSADAAAAGEYMMAQSYRKKGSDEARGRWMPPAVSTGAAIP